MLKVFSEFPRESSGKLRGTHRILEETLPPSLPIESSGYSLPPSLPVCGKFRAFARFSRARKRATRARASARKGVFARLRALRALRAPRFFRALARLRTRRPGYRAKASPAPGSPFFCRLSSFLSFLLPFLLLLFLNPWLSERIRDPKKQCLRSTRKLAGIEAQRGRGPGNHGPHAP